jgi:protein-disulfide isomerase
MAGNVERIEFKELSEQTGLELKRLARAINSRTTWHKVKNDIAAGIKLGITGTPAYVIDGVIYQAQIPPEIIRKVIE